MAERVDPANLPDDLVIQRVVEVPVDEDEERRRDPRLVLELRHLEGVRRREVDVVPERDEALGERAGTGREILKAHELEAAGLRLVENGDVALS